jgi:hypothetical protein
MNRVLLGIVTSFFCLHVSFGQELPKGQKRWSSNNKLSLKDFKIQIDSSNNNAVFSQFMISHAIGGLDFMKRNLNQKIENIFLGNASWIDTTRINTIEKQIDFQQMQFDLAEIQARKFRKRILTNKSKITKGFDIVNKINNEIISELAEIRLELIKDTENGRNAKKVEEWRKKIATELETLEEFRFANKKKIKLTE